METYDKREIMERAWDIKREFPNRSFSACLTQSWMEAKRLLKEKPPLSKKSLKRIRERLWAFALVE